MFSPFDKKLLFVVPVCTIEGALAGKLLEAVSRNFFSAAVEDLIKVLSKGLTFHTHQAEVVCIVSLSGPSVAF